MMCSILGEFNQLPEWQTLHFIYFSKVFQFTCTVYMKLHVYMYRIPELYQENFRPKLYKNTELFLNFSVFFKIFLYYSNNIRKIKGPMAKTDNISFICFILLSEKAQ